jgi:hypothetical protein
MSAFVDSILKKKKFEQEAPQTVLKDVARSLFAHFCFHCKECEGYIPQKVAPRLGEGQRA